VSETSFARFRAELVSYAQRYPDGPVKMVDLTGVDLAQVIRAHLVPHAGSLDRAAQLVRSGKLPLGALAAAASRSYTTMLIEQSCACCMPSQRITRSLHAKSRWRKQRSTAKWWPRRAPWP